MDAGQGKNGNGKGANCSGIKDCAQAVMLADDAQQRRHGEQAAESHGGNSGNLHPRTGQGAPPAEQDRHHIANTPARPSPTPRVETAPFPTPGRGGAPARLNRPGTILARPAPAMAQPAIMMAGSLLSGPITSPNAANRPPVQTSERALNRWRMTSPARRMIAMEPAKAA